MNFFLNYFDSSIEKLAYNFLSQIKYGKIKVIFPSNKVQIFQGIEQGYEANIQLNNYNLFYKLIKKGSVGFAESYMDSDFATNNLSKLLLFARQNELSYLKQKKAKFLNNFIIKTQHYMNKNTKLGSKKNISHHYDLGNNFYKHWLDESMTYSSALFKDKNDDLLKAQINKYIGIAEHLKLNDNSKLLEIGCGWGGFSTFVAKKYGTKVKAITISKEQFDFASKKIAKEGLNEKISLEMQDYRDVTEKFTNIVSIEMFEAVGKEYWQQFFEKIKNSLFENGLATMQIITINDSKADYYQSNPDFIQQYIFPGGVLPSKKQLKEITHLKGLKFSEYRSFSNSYVKTLKEWNEKFQNSWIEISEQGFSDRFKRMWEYYFSYCQAGFISGTTDVSQFIIKK